MKKLFIMALTMLSAISFAANVIFDAKSDKAVEFAAKDMARCLSIVTGKQYKAVKSATPAAGDIIIKDSRTLETQQWQFVTKDGILTISGRGAPGMVYGVYSFLEKYANCSWPAPDTEIIPKNEKWQLPQLNEKGRPAYLRREMYVGGDLMDYTWRMRNKENYAALFQLNMYYGKPSNSHSFDRYVNHIKDPKLFGPRKGGGQSTTICMTNPKVRKIILDAFVNYIENDRKSRAKSPAYMIPKIYEFGQTDGPSWPECWCESCKALCEKEGSYAGPNVDFVNYMARAVKDKYPNILLETFAYSYTIVPPKNIKAEDNVMIRYCGAWLYRPLVPDTPNGKEFQAWVKKAKYKSIWSYWRTFEGVLYPFVKPRKDIAAELKFCHENGVISYFAENEEPLSRSFAPQQHYLFLKMAENPYQDINKLNDKFFKEYFGKAAPVMLEYLDFLEKNQKENKSHINKAFFEKVNAWLDEAEKLTADDPLSNRHVRGERVVVDRTAFLFFGALTKEGYKFDTVKVANRLKKNASDILKSWRPLQVNKTASQRIKNIEQEASLFAHYPVKVPEKFDGLEVHDIHWTSIAGTAVDDPDAVCGVAKMNPKYKHGNSYNFGFYNSRLSKGDGITIAKEDIPQDEKYHLYKLGKALIMRPLNIIHDSTWHYRTRIPTISIIPHEREIWISAKFQGPNYVAGSKKPNAVLFDRIMLVKNDQPLREYKPVNPKNNILKNGNFEGFSKAWLYYWGKFNENCKIDTKIKTSGRSALRIDGDVSKSCSFIQDLGKVENLKHDLLIRGKYKYSGIKAGSLPFIGIWTNNSKGGNTTYNLSAVQFYVGDYDWQEFEYVVDIERFKKACAKAKPSPAVNASLRIMLYRQPGTVWVDDLQVIPLEKKDNIKKMLEKYEPVNKKLNMIKNGSFEQQSKAWLYNWCKFTENISPDTQDKTAGKCSIRVTGNEKKSISFDQNLGKIENLKNDLLVRFKYKYKDIKDGKGMVFIGFWNNDAKGNNTYFNLPMATNFSGNSDWQQFETIVDIETFKKNCINAKPNPVVSTNFKIFMFYKNGTLWIDEVEVIPLKKK